ncbi:MAG: type II toxin-antitoxin system death-on-curing family toxin [Candidatus Nanopelagicaceae bacterium]
MIKYLSLTQVLHVAEVVTGLPFETVKKVAQLNLIESAIAAPQSSFIGLDPYPELFDKAAILAFHLARNHALPDGNKRLAFLSAYEFCWINGYELEFDVDQAEQIFFGLAAGTVNIQELTIWIKNGMRKI